MDLKKLMEKQIKFLEDITKIQTKDHRLVAENHGESCGGLDQQIIDQEENKSEKNNEVENPSERNSDERSQKGETAKSETDTESSEKVCIFF